MPLSDEKETSSELLTKKEKEKRKENISEQLHLQLE